MIKKYFIVFFIFVFTQAYAQDPIHTQFFMIPETLSSSFTGAKKSTRAGIIHRTQWPGLNFSLNTQFAFVDNWFDKFNSGIGISVLNHQETTTRYSFTQVNLNYAYHFPISSEWNARPSISFGYGAKDFGFQNLLLEDQINIFSGIINNTSIDLINLNDSVRFVDFSASVLFNSENSWVGLTFKHLNKPNISMQFDGQSNLDMFMSLHSSIYVPTGNNYRNDYKLYILTNAMQQGDYNRLDLGAKYQMDTFSFALLAATNPNKVDPNSHFLTSINAFMGLDWEGFRFGYSYDFNMSDIGRTGGVYELSVIYDFDNKRCDFGCPDY
ncbi:MAG: PorP/SprF family type IX secretion system membrane protein [Flavobacteriales bacterium]|jgi:type IX secretion system PorP/SprF family membrane protein|tara:strand:+ start:2483 stop:3457 length:975 start_codon:yes stop_codon:yes gene_type:complete